MVEKREAVGLYLPVVAASVLLEVSVCVRFP